MKRKNKDLTEGSIPKLLAQLTWPMIFGMLGMVIFNLVDTYFVGKLGTDQLAALSFSFPVVMMVGSITMGMGIGTSALISRMIVSKDRSVVQDYSGDAINLSLLTTLIFVIAGQLTLEPLFNALGASEEMMSYIKEYMVTWYWGMIFLVVPMVGNNIIRATGDTFTPGMIMVFATVTNIILDPLLIFGYGPFPEMGLKGAALATVISRAAGMVLSLYILIVRDKLLTIYIPKMKAMLQTWGKVMYVAGPAAAGLLIIPLSLGIITRMVAGYGEEAVAAFGVVSRIEMFAMMIINALASVMTIFSGQNWGKEKVGRIRESLRVTSLFSLAWGVLIYIVSRFWAEDMAGIFSPNAEVVRITTRYLIIVSLSYGFQGILMVGVAIFNGVNQPLKSTALTFLRMMGLYIPLALILSKQLELLGIFWAAFIANVLVGFVTYIWLRGSLRKSMQVITVK